MKVILFNQNDNLVQLTGVTDSTGAPVTGAMLSGTLTPVAGGAVAANLTFGDLNGQPGNYQASLLAADVPAPGAYTLVVSGTANGLTLRVQADAKVLTRRI
jgi:hypothetical protein